MAQVDKNGIDGRDCVAVGSNGYLYYSTDYGVNWSRFGSVTGVSHAAVARSSGVAKTTGSPIWYTAGSTVYFARIGGSAALASVAVGGTAQQICCSGDGVYAFTSYNAGSSWQTGYQTYIQKITRSSESAATIATKGTFNTWDQSAGGKAACSVNGQYAVIGGAAGFTNGFQTTNYGESWSECLATQSFGNGMRDIDCSATGQYFASTTPSGRPVSVNSLSSWYMDGSGASFQGTTICQQPGLNANYTYYYVVGTTLYRYGRDGSTTVSISIPVQFNSLQSNAQGSKLIALGSNGYVYYSHNFGATWTATSLSGITEISMVKYL